MDTVRDVVGTVVVCLFAVGIAAGAGANRVEAADDGRPASRGALKALRKKAAHRTRRIIFDNDGNDVLYLDKADADELIESRTKALVGSHVDTVVYCSLSAGFGQFTYNTKIGNVFTSKDGRYAKNKTKEFIAQGTDPLRIIVDFCRREGIEVFWSMRMNDTHDAYTPALFPPLKKEHPEWLMGARGTRFENGRWSAVDYGHEEVRDYAFRFIEEVCQNYEIDGVMMDFFRHPVFFKRHALGEAVGQEELDQMTLLVRRVRAMADREGLKRGRPILIATRVPDSVEWCRAIGLDIARWMDEGLIDLLVVSGYFRLNPWEASVALGHKYGVPVYGCLSETRLKDAEAKEVRASRACYRGRAATVWNAGADGIYTFNFFQPKNPLLHEMGEPAVITQHDRVYCTGARGVAACDFWFTGGLRWLNRSVLSPEQPRALEPGAPVTVELDVGEDVAEGGPVDVTLRLRVADLVDADALAVTLNGKPLGGGAKTGDWIVYGLEPTLVARGVNGFEMMLRAGSDVKATLQDLLVWVRPKQGSQG
jgi:hypothetical protein